VFALFRFDAHSPFSVTDEKAAHGVIVVSVARRETFRAAPFPVAARRVVAAFSVVPWWLTP
jgi:hypothetical protein